MLAVYAATPENSGGREFEEAPPLDRSEFRRDYARVIHSPAFRRLQYKTQVFGNEQGDLFRTRLTHSLEVAQLARAGAESLNLNQDLAETLGVAHDLGHPPFGHLGQDVLNMIMKDHGGFEHNWQAIRVVDELEYIDDRFKGLNLMRATREGLLKHCTKERAFRIGAPAARHLNGQAASLESQLVDWCDAIAYNHADLEDSLMMGYVSVENLKSFSWFADSWPKENVQEDNNQRVASRILRKRYSHFMIDLVENSKKNLSEAKLTSLEDVRKHANLIGLSEPIRDEHYAIKRFMRKYVYSSPDLLQRRQADGVILMEVMSYYLAHPEKMKVPAGMAPFERNPRGVCDFVSGMTERYVLQAHAQIIKTQEFEKLPKKTCIFDEAGDLQAILPVELKMKKTKNKP